MKLRLQKSDSKYAKRYLKVFKKNKSTTTLFSGISKSTLNNNVVSTIFGNPILEVPRTFDIIKTNFDDKLSHFMSDLESALEIKHHIYLSFEKTEEINLPMLLLIYALQDKYNTKISIIWSKNRFVNRLIKESGSFTSINHRRESLSDGKYKNIHVISGSNAEFNELSDQLIDSIINKYYKGNIPPAIESNISQAIIETLENVGRHAYPEEPEDRDKKWWLVCSIGQHYEEKDKYMFLAIYDSGRGIPLSLEDSEVFQKRVKKHYPNEYKKLIHGTNSNEQPDLIRTLVRTFKQRVSSFREIIGDSGLIHASMMHDMTRLDDDNHGQGSVSIKELITDDPQSKLFILSNRGCYQYNKGATEEDEHVKVELANELKGTLLQWSIKLDEF